MEPTKTKNIKETIFSVAEYLLKISIYSLEVSGFGLNVQLRFQIKVANIVENILRFFFTGEIVCNATKKINIPVPQYIIFGNDIYLTGMSNWVYLPSFLFLTCPSKLTKFTSSFINMK